jgi:hypothetical protein
MNRRLMPARSCTSSGYAKTFYIGNVILLQTLSGHLNACAIDYHIFKYPDMTADESIFKRFNNAIEVIERDCDDLKFEHVQDFIANLKHKLSRQPLTYGELGEAARNIFTIYQSELRTRLFVFVSADRAGYFAKDDLFGEVVSASFLPCAQDIKDAGTCYALEQDTACVMHLMRVLEVSLVALAHNFSGIETDRKEWNIIIESIEKRVRAIGPGDGLDWKEQRDFYSGVCNQFMFFKNAWRNHAMHARVRYNGPEAFDILDHVRQFMQHLGQRVTV